MPKPREQSIEERYRDRVRDHLGLPVVKLNLQGRRAWPDRMIVLPNGRTLFIEFKCPGEEPEPLQRHIHEQLRRLGHRVEVFDKVAEAYAFTERVAYAVDEGGALQREPVEFERG